MIKDGKQTITHEGKNHIIMTAGYRYIQHKWSFKLKGRDSGIFSGHKIRFLDTEMSVTFTCRKKNETFIEAWII